MGQIRQIYIESWHPFSADPEKEPLHSADPAKQYKLTKKKDPYVQKTSARYPVLEFLFRPDSRKSVLRPNPKKNMMYDSRVDFNTCPLSMGNTMPESTLSLVRDL